MAVDREPNPQRGRRRFDDAGPRNTLILDRPALARCREFDGSGTALGDHGRMQSELVRTPYGPIPMVRDEALDRGNANSRRHDDFDSPAREDAHRQPTCTA